MKCLAWTPLLLLLACEMSRPYGSFQPRPDAGGPVDRDGDDDRDAGSDEDEPGSETGVVIPPRNPPGDGGTSEGPELPPVDSPLAAYAGTYLMRMDMYSTLSLPVGATTIVVKNRISNFILAEIGVEGDELVGHETFCHQAYAHDCTNGCAEGWTTTPDPGLTRLFPRANAPRRYRIEGDSLIAEESIVALGFDEDNVTADTEIPADVSDPRLWKPNDGKVGIVTRLQTKVRVAGFTQPLDCEVSAVQLFGTTFEGALGDPEAPLEGVRFGLAVSNLPGAPLAAAGAPSQFCNTKAVNEQEAQVGPESTSYVRLRKTDILGECPPIGVFEEELPADPP